ncbi:hypothetical protein PS2_014997 [Malus domestica]
MSISFKSFIYRAPASRAPASKSFIYKAPASRAPASKASFTKLQLANFHLQSFSAGYTNTASEQPPLRLIHGFNLKSPANRPY